MGGRDKPALVVGDRTMLDRVLDAVAGAAPRITVGPYRPDLPGDVIQVREDPPGGGPVAALAAGLAAVRADTGSVAVLAADLPFLTPADIDALRAAAGDRAVDGAVLLDGDRRAQWLCGVYRIGPLRRRLAALGPPAGQPMRAVATGLRLIGVQRAADPAPPWYDCDTEDDYRKANGLT
jgi:molybdenum cofactor guanylyltransferase